MTVEIKKYRIADLDNMMVIWRAATVLAHDFQGAAELERDEAMIRNEFMDKTESWTAWLNGELVGFISLAEKLIVALFVDPTLHRGGVGSALMAHVNCLHGPLSVEVFANNPIGIPFYKKHGFRLLREEENPYYPGQTNWIMGQDGVES